jgi:hypothetical protein
MENILRYLLLTYYQKPTGQIDEVMAVSKNLKKRDLTTCNVILDFKNLSVIKCSMAGTNVPRDFDRIAGYYHEHYAATIERLFNENGYEVEVNTQQPTQESPV